jgi:hypothetical protein
LDLLKPPRKRVGTVGLEVPRWDGLLWQGYSTECDSSSNIYRDQAEEELSDSHAGGHTGGREIINPESDAAGDSNCNSNSNSNTGVMMDTDAGSADCVPVPDLSAVNFPPDSSGVTVNLMDTAQNEFLTDERQTLSFNVIREERYVQAFRVEFMSRTDEMDAREVDEAFLCSLMNTGGDNNKKNESFCSRNGLMFYSLMECLVSKPPLCLPFQSMLPVLLVPAGRGVCRDGAAIFMPSKDDYLEFVYYHEKRTEPSLSSSRQANKRLGEWRGVNSNIPKNLTIQDARKKRSPEISTKGDMSDPNPDRDPMCGDLSPACAERSLIGYVTSGRYCGSPCGSVSYGFCDATLLQEMAISAAHLLLEYQGIGVGTTGSGSPPRGRVLSLVMFRSPRSRWLRPALVEIVSVLQ